VHRVLAALKTGQDQPSWLQSFRFFFFGNYFNVLLILIPLGAVAHFANWDAGLRFAFNFLAIMPLARLIGVATDELSLPLGQSWAGLLNATFGNAVEIIVGIAALFQDEMRIVQTSLLGSVLSNILLVLGCAFIGGGWNTEIQQFSETGAQVSSSLMTLSAIALVLPAAYHFTKFRGSVPFDNPSNPNITAWLSNVLTSPPGEPPLPDDRSRAGLLTISRGTAILLLLVYIAYLFFELKTHAYVFKAAEEEEEEEAPKMNPAAAGFSLLLITVVTSFSADWLVASIEETAERYHIPQAFIGIILLPIVANAAEHVTAVWMAVKGKMEMPVSICIGSSIQIICFVIPLLVVVGWISGHNLTLFFADFETISLFVSVILVNTLIMDGKTHYMEGLILVVLYLIIAIAYWVS